MTSNPINTDENVEETTEEFVVTVEDMKKFVVEAMRTVGTSADHAAQLAEALVLADQRGHHSHGVNRLHIYIEDTLGNVAKSGQPEVLKRKGATAWVDGRNLLGPVVGNFCTRLAVELAREHGIGWVVCKGSNHYGICGYYTLQIAEAGFVGMSFTNTSPCVFPNRSAEQALGSNPISCVAPALDGDNFALDMATSTVAFGKVELAETKGHAEIPAEWGADANGRPTTRPADVLQGGGLLPLGGREEAGAYKGTGLGMMVEVFCGLLGGTPAGRDCRQWRESEKAANLAQCFVAVDPDCFAPDFPARMQRFLDQNRELRPVDAERPVLVAGDPERAAEERNRAAGGLIYGRKQIDKLRAVAEKYSIAPFTALSHVNTSVVRWFGELEKFGFTAGETSKFNHFTAMIWAHAKQVACAVRNCRAGKKRRTLVFCNYLPK
ncbi:hypothetical protein M3Y99_00478400 [Aphelenchoides fujianensis]|nr:hypothetical protein M3Y99_00478400 [Aphelenchoides fujianensis]